MEIDPRITTLVADIDAATTAISTRIQKLIDDAKLQGTAFADQVVAVLQPEADKLKALGSSGPDSVK